MTDFETGSVELPIRLKIFVSSPGDVGTERAIALAVMKRLQLEFKGLVELEPVLWELALLRATSHFQSEITDIQETDLALFILWSRLGTPLPTDVFCRPDGGQYASGTEYEFEMAREAFENLQRPDIVCYQKTADVSLSKKNEQLAKDQFAQLHSVNEFGSKWFKNADGTFKSAFFSFERAAQFEEMFENHLRDWIKKRLRTAGISTGRHFGKWDDPPFRGLEKFEFEHAVIYCGRTHLVSEVLDSLRRRAALGRPFLMITGMSGVGKSSLVRAGVLPLLTTPKVVEHVLTWRRAVYIPNNSEIGLMEGLAAALKEPQALPELQHHKQQNNKTSIEAALRDHEQLPAALLQAFEDATRCERERTQGADAVGDVKLVVVIDQFEEIFAEKVGVTDRVLFVDALRAMISTGRIWVIATLRADFFSRCSELPERFRDLFMDRGGIYTVGGPRGAELAQMIRRPALLGGLEFDRRPDRDEGLDDALLEAASGRPTVLPLLEFTLDELWRRSRAAKVTKLRFSDYRDLQGLDGALKVRASEEFDRLPSVVQGALSRVLGALVEIDATDRLVLQQRVPLAKFSDSLDCQALIKSFVEARLMVADETPDHVPVVGFAHEVLLREWPPAVKWLADNRDLLRRRAGIDAAETLWRNEGFKKKRLLRGAALRDARQLLKDPRKLLGEPQQDFALRSMAAHRKRLFRQGYQAVAGVAAIAAAGVVLFLGPDQIGHRASVAMALPFASNHHGKPALSQEAMANVDASINALSAHLRERISLMGESAELTPWAVAQMSIALHGSNLPAVPGPDLGENS